MSHSGIRNNGLVMPLFSVLRIVNTIRTGFQEAGEYVYIPDLANYVYPTVVHTIYLIF